MAPLISPQDGYFKLFLDGVRIYSKSGDFGHSDTFSFTIEVPPPTVGPTPEPTPMPVACGVCDHSLRLVVTTDQYADESSYTLKTEEATVCASDVYGPYYYFSSYRTYSTEVHNALCEGMDYTFAMYDKYCDGICCGTWCANRFMCFGASAY